MKTERLALAGTLGLLVLAAVAAVLPWLTPGLVDWRSVLWLLLRATTSLFAVTALLWSAMTYVVGAGYEPPRPVHGAEDVQVRILTVDAADVVRATVDSLPDEFDDVRVIAESDIDVVGATVHVVPDGFECDAVRKGRAQE